MYRWNGTTLTTGVKQHRETCDVFTGLETNRGYILIGDLLTRFRRRKFNLNIYWRVILEMTLQLQTVGFLWSPWTKALHAAACFESRRIKVIFKKLPRFRTWCNYQWLCDLLLMTGERKTLVLSINWFYFYLIENCRRNVLTLHLLVYTYCRLWIGNCFDCFW